MCLGSASLTWWGTAAFMLIEGTGFALLIAVYLYLLSVAPSWPIDSAPHRTSPRKRSPKNIRARSSWSLSR